MSPKPASPSLTDARKTKKELLAELRELKEQFSVLKGTGAKKNGVDEASREDDADCTRMERTLWESKERFDYALRAAREGIWDWNMETDEVHYSPRYKEMLGYSEDEVEPHASAWVRLMHPDDRERALKVVDSVMHGGREYEMEFRMRHKDGHYVDILSRGYPIRREASGPVTRIVGTHMDITERNRMADELRRARDEIVMRVWERTAELQRSNDELNTQIAERERANEALHESEEKYRRIVEMANEGIWTLDQDNVTTFVNPRMARMLGYSPEEIVGRTPHDFLGEEYKEDVHYHLNIRHEGIRDQYICKYLRKDGSDLWAIVSGTPLHDGNGEYTGAIAMITDITERKRAEEALRESQALLQAINEGSPDPIFVKDLNSRIIYGNPTLLSVFEKSLDEVVGKTDLELYDDPAIAEAIMENDRKVLESGRSQVIEEVIKTRNGLRTYLSTKTPFRNGHGDIVGILGIARDITERKRAEEAVWKSEASLAKAQRITHLGSWNWDLKDDRVFCSDEFYRVFGLDRMDYITYGQFIETLRPGDRDRVNRAVEAALYKREPYDIDYCVLWPDGSERIVHAEGEVTYGPDEAPVEMFGTVQDITERKRAEEALNSEKQRAELYLDLMGHDINNLLQVGIGFLEMSRETGKKSPEEKEYIEKALGAMKNGSNLIENVRKLQKVETHALNQYPIYVCKLLTDVRSDFLKVPNREVTINVTHYCECVVEANDFLKDVFTNLVGNAIKHSTGPLTIDINVSEIFQDGIRYCKVSIEDNGPGIPPELKGRLFTRFQRGSTKAHGKGLGLYLVKTLIDDYKGKIYVADRVPGDHTQGARFVVILPVVKKKLLQ